MIVSIESTLKTFKPVTFRSGLNVLLSDRTANSTDKQTRNSAGKTSLVEIIHFLLGADCEKESLFRLDSLVEHTFKGAPRRFAWNPTVRINGRRRARWACEQAA